MLCKINVRHKVGNLSISVYWWTIFVAHLTNSTNVKNVIINNNVVGITDWVLAIDGQNTPRAQCICS